MTPQDFQNDISTWNSLKNFLEGLDPAQKVGIYGNDQPHPMALFLRIKYQDPSLVITKLMCQVNFEGKRFECLTPVWLSDYTSVFVDRAGSDYIDAATALALLNRTIERFTPPEQPQDTPTDITASQ